ncbi:uncharacterized protein N0V89_005675 [Didymosphaeria variabile]|uniref:KANL3/Tex30 alpha/beta hydrolase-like domain-containing protein n=1 Tax=Didymosphaeria variabile TaxID=1932322 RepID=A0A9W8XNC2_9PLEO|nr:uncharacterized protein N0V89_005675 [Didymosphaeria variabile]KAJ4353943.1 hypothetical protein N0V89_005675 [Didymosphaeria variabile]
MPPKRRNGVDHQDATEPKRRMTRSASKATAPVKEATKSKSEGTVVKPSKTTKGAKKATSPRKKTSKPINDTTDNNASSEGTTATTLTIEHDSLKKPITCHQYTTSSEIPHLPTLIFTHGAGGTLSAPAVVNFCNGYSKTHSTLAFQGSMNLNARVKGFDACISHLSLEAGYLILGGRSMGARAAVIAGTNAITGGTERGLSLILVSYPLKGPKNDIRDKILLDLPENVRVLFVVGEKDEMCPLELLKKTRTEMAAKSKLVVVRGADHGMHVRPTSEEKRLGEETGKLAAAWADGEGDDEDVYID